MPELPEVQIVVNGLNQFVCGLRIEEVLLHWPGYLSGSSQKKFIKALSGSKIGRASRRGKYIFIEIGQHTLQLHLRMTGVLRIREMDEEMAPHTHLQLFLAGGKRLDFSDVRKFGRVQLVDSEPLREHVLSLGLGPDPLLDEFDGERLAEIASHRSKSIRNILLDQKLVAGVGNIYAAEILFRAGVSPQRSGFNIEPDEFERIARETREVLSAAIVKGGSSINDYLQVSGQQGEMQNYFQVYGRQGSECPRCGDTILKMKDGGRGSFYCPGCQK